MRATTSRIAPCPGRLCRVPQLGEQIRAADLDLVAADLVTGSRTPQPDGDRVDALLVMALHHPGFAAAVAGGRDWHLEDNQPLR